jgi:hypothetical protein
LGIRPVRRDAWDRQPCVGQSITTLIREFGGINAAAAGTGFPSVSALQNAIMAFCEG